MIPRGNPLIFPLHSVAADNDILDYDYDSEAEWEDPEEGEELKSDDENDEEEGGEKFATHFRDLTVSSPL